MKHPHRCVCFIHLIFGTLALTMGRKLFSLVYLQVLWVFLSDTSFVMGSRTNKRSIRHKHAEKINGSFTVFMSWNSHFIHGNVSDMNFNPLWGFHHTIVQVKNSTTSLKYESRFYFLFAQKNVSSIFYKSVLYILWIGNASTKQRFLTQSMIFNLR